MVFYGPQEVARVDVFVLQVPRVTLRFFGGAAPDVAPLCENMVCTGRLGHRQVPQRLICRQAYRDRSFAPCQSHSDVSQQKTG